ncbi:hypothetical protein RB620_24575 [Paenibacillus sp. LHD-117]|uniref:hypothetical protein n=1 Tax=Paenibacillus sp. LHD-117 TaxID=3071412 RepID=UPI0027E1A9E8|nr:hypothetical protein [Paenibacillus sp. LHD-117]MDQ6422612.1 hypothetical protein [Paenibacillus sp. LHD-117]
MISFETMLVNKALIQQAAQVFGEKIRSLNPKESSIEQYNENVGDTISDLELSASDAEIVQAFFDTYIGVLQTDRAAATEFVQTFMRPTI